MAHKCVLWHDCDTWPPLRPHTVILGFGSKFCYKLFMEDQSFPLDNVIFLPMSDTLPLYHLTLFLVEKVYYWRHNAALSY